MMGKGKRALMVDVRNVGSRKRANLKEEVAQHLRDMILSGVLRPGQRLDQDKLTEQLGVSRIPLREALIHLESEGLIENIARHGSYVAALAPQDIQDHYEMYGRLSGLAAERAAELPHSDLEARLEALIDEMKVTFDPREHDRLNFSFHQAINKAGSSGRLLVVLRLLSNSMPSHYFEYGTGSEWREQAVMEHTRILDAIRASEGSVAAQEVAQHFRNTGQQAVARLKAVGFWDPDGQQRSAQTF